MYGGTKFLVFLLTILIFMQLSKTPFAEQNQQCVPSSCGHIHNIRYIFRLKSDPKHCDRENYELSCEGDHPILTIFPHNWFGSLNYHVQAINYDNSTIRLMGPAIREGVICSLPQNSITFYTTPLHLNYITRYIVPITVPITLFSCPFAINSSVFVEITNCLNRSYASNVSSDIFKDANANISILSLHNALAYGFELSWFRDIYCYKCDKSIYNCVGENSRDVRCVDLSCKTYNFRFFKTLCGKNIPYAMLKFKTLLALWLCIIPWILPIAGKPRPLSLKFVELLGREELK
ncbi:uncharacterized protein LOC132628543 [Lycium barbarum]|uniref:uncharacterized protein LOC132628543 n=1 Tax=Lycium barbarum TaxID=112863 RepID=UPI00293F6A21|nr:uncharacterized protein LOC132628543 [Lycium barbarum]